MLIGCFCIFCVIFRLGPEGFGKARACIMASVALTHANLGRMWVSHLVGSTLYFRLKQMITHVYIVFVCWWLYNY